jgi:YfiH family protein
MAQKLMYSFSTVADGNMSFKWGEEAEVTNNRKKWLEKMGIKYKDCIWMALQGGTDIYIVSEKDKEKEIAGDALITTDKNTALFMVTADCLPVIIYSDEMLALVHAGWRGVDGKIVQKTINKMKELSFDSFGPSQDKFAQDCKMIIGPGTKKETYIKYGDKLEEFYQAIKTDKKEWQEFLIDYGNGKIGLDLVEFVIKQARDLGVKRENIEISPIDTIKDTDYFSHYRAGETGEKEGRFATVVELKR